MTIIERALGLAAERWMLRHLDRAYWLWDRVNERSFSGMLSTPFIEIDLPSRGIERPDLHAWADIGAGDQHGVRLRVRLHRELLRGTDPDYARTLDSYLLHEMVHAWQVEALGWDWDLDNDWHGRTFRSKLAEVERAYDLDLEVTRRITWR
jgi:hypothetical protein